jgi:hypothetical protein
VDQTGNQEKCSEKNMADERYVKKYRCEFRTWGNTKRLKSEILYYDRKLRVLQRKILDEDYIRKKGEVVLTFGLIQKVISGYSPFFIITIGRTNL